MTAAASVRLVKLSDVARAAGVHPASVSRALRGASSRVSADTRTRIERIAMEMGYLPNALAVALRTKRTDLVAVVVPDLGNPLFAPIVRGVEGELAKLGLMCLITQPPSDAQDRVKLVRLLAHRNVSGLLVLSAETDDPMLDEAQRLALPTVLVNRGAGEHRFSSVVNDDKESVRLVLEHLTMLGHRHVAHIAGPSKSSTGKARLDAYLQLCPGFAIAPTVIEATAFTRDAGRAACLALIDATVPSPTAIFAANDLIAMGVLDALRRRGLASPNDVSLVGHNDMPLVDLVTPALTTVRVSVDKMGRTAAQLFADQLLELRNDPRTIVLKPELVVRDSSGTPRCVGVNKDAEDRTPSESGSLDLRDDP